MDLNLNQITKSWLESLHHSTMIAYQTRIKDFESYCLEHSEWTKQQAFLNYVIKLHEQNTSASSLWSVYSILGKYAKKQYSIDLETQNKAVSDLIKQWSKTETVKQAPVNNKNLWHFIIIFILYRHSKKRTYYFIYNQLQM
jgi:hypothetical protein